MPDNLKNALEKEFSSSFNRNQSNELQRLICEICVREELNPELIIKRLTLRPEIKKAAGKTKFFVLKKALLKLRFPLTSKNVTVCAKDVYLPVLKKAQAKLRRPGKEFVPQKIFIEKGTEKSYLALRFKKKFPQVEIQELNYCAEYLKNNKFTLSQLKTPLVFIVKEHWDFIKPCPCTKNHLGCNYWIFNLGFGCPFDCSYCFLQAYSNFPGITLPSNLDDFFNKFDDFYKRINKPIRIGTGEFCDSLALDEITGYSKQLIDFFRDKNLFFELKTKSNKIHNLLDCSASSNIIISWSLNPQRIITEEEIACVSLEERINSAKEIQKKGFSLAFHFDPIIYSSQWEIEYKNVIDRLYQNLKPPFKWISLGTLRANRQLKPIVEQRFPESKIFYGELFLGEDKKLRYPEFLRIDIYKKMLAWLKSYDTKTPIYLCMENKTVWQESGLKGFSRSKEIEEYLLKTS